jgi:hypothetical protein
VASEATVAIDTIATVAVLTTTSPRAAIARA